MLVKSVQLPNCPSPSAGRPWPAQDQVWQDHEESSQEDRQQREGAGGHLHHGGQRRGRGDN